MYWRWMVAATLLALAGCSSEEHSDLKQELAALTKDVRGRVDPLPEVKPYEPARYTGEREVDPFRPDRLDVAMAGAAAASAHPDLNRPREPLEAFALEEIKVVGTLKGGAQVYAIVQAGGTLHRIRKGNYLGRNSGNVTEITATEIRVAELVQEGSGEWVERISALPLGELSDPQLVLPGPIQHVVPVLFATNRKKSGVNRPGDYFLDREADNDEVTMGRAAVRVPKAHKRGEVEEPPWIRIVLQRLQDATPLDLGFRAEDPERHFSFAYPIEELTRKQFGGDLKQLLGASRSRSALLFVHGYANSFKDAVFRTAQFSFDLRTEGYDTVPLLFSWPSDPASINYGGAKDRIRSASWHLAAYLELLLRYSGTGVVHIVAHSMGADVLAEALGHLGEAKLVAKRRRGKLLPKFNQIVLAAPDIRAADFGKVIAPAIASGHRVTNYASSNDAALRISKTFNAGARAGDTLNGPKHVDKVETIDASTVNSELAGHSFFAESPAMVRDLSRLLRDGDAPAARGLKPVRRAGGTYWIFP